MRFDGVERKRINVHLSKEAVRLFEDISPIKNLSEYIENRILEDFNNPNLIIEKRNFHMNELKRLNEKIKNDGLKGKQQEQIKKAQEDSICDLCGMDQKDTKELHKLEKGKFKVCKSCFKATPNLMKELKAKEKK